MSYLAALLRFRDILSSYLLVCLFIRVIKCLPTLSRPRGNALSQSGVLETRQNTANNSQVCSLPMTSEIGSRELTSYWLTVSTTPTWWSTPYSRSVHAGFLQRSLWLCEWVQFSLISFLKRHWFFIQVFDAFKDRLLESNSKVNLHALESLPKIISVLKNDMSRVVNILFPAIVDNHLNSKNNAIYSAAVGAINALILHLGI